VTPNPAATCHLHLAVAHVGYGARQAKHCLLGPLILSLLLPLLMFLLLLLMAC
jgi:hypothetical protein